MKKKILLFFIIILFILTLAPITGDDWGNFVTNPTGDILSSIKLAYGMYFTWEGRIVSRILIYILTAHKMIYNIITALLLTGIYTVGLKMMGDKCKPIFQNLLFVGLLLLNCNMFAQGYNWVAGAITYLYPTAIFIIYFYLIFKNREKLSKLQIVLYSLINIIAPMFVENIGCAFVLGNVILLGYDYLRNKKINFKMLLFCVLSGFALLIMLLSPGSAIRAEESSGVGLVKNFYEFIKYTFMMNPILILFMSIPSCYTLLNIKQEKIKKVRVILTVLFSIIPILTIIQNLTLVIPVRVELNMNLGMMNEYLSLFWILFIELYIYSICIIYKNNREKKNQLLILFGSSLASSFIMILTSTWGERIVLLSVLSTIIISVNMMSEIIPDKKIIKVLTSVLLIGTILGYSLIMMCASKINKERIDYINLQVSEGKKVLDLYYSPMRIIWNPNIPDDYFVVTYREYLGLDDSYSFNVIKLSIKEYIKMVMN